MHMTKLCGLALLLSSTHIFAASATLSETAGKGDSLLDIYGLAKTNDHEFKSQYAQFKASSEAAAINRAALRPQISGTASASYADADTQGTTPQETETDRTTYGVSLEQVIINNNAWQTYEQGKVETKAALATLQANELSLMVRSAEAYFNVLRAQDQLETAKAEEKAQETLLEQTKQRYEVGLISINDVHETQAAYDSAVAATISAEASVGIQFDSLTVLTGTFHERIVPLKENFAASSPTPTSQQRWVEFALNNNYTLKASKLTAEANKLQAKAAKSNHLPTLTGAIGYTDDNRDIDTVGATTTETDTDTATISLTLNIPLYTGGSLSALERQAAQTAISAQENYLLTQRRTIQNTRSLYLSVTSDIAQIKARKQAIVSNESALEATRAGYDAGTRDIVDVVNAQRNLFQAQRDYFDALYSYIVNTLLLKEAAGNLALADLEALEQVLAK